MVTQSALLVIDVQESFRHKPYFSGQHIQDFFGNIQKLCDGAKKLGIPIVRVLHVEEEGPFAEKTGLVVPMKELQFEPIFIVRKRKHSALAGTELASWLVEQGVNKLIVSGIRTEQCCETTTRHASDSGYRVDFVGEATLTFDMKHANGRLYKAEEIRERTELVLADRFARICTVKQALNT